MALSCKFVGLVSFKSFRNKLKNFKLARFMKYSRLTILEFFVGENEKLFSVHTHSHVVGIKI